MKEVTTDDRHALLAKEYLQATAKEPPLVVSPTHAEGRSVTRHIRDGLRERGAIGKEDREFLQLKSLNLTAAERQIPETYRQKNLLVQFH